MPSLPLFLVLAAFVTTLWAAWPRSNPNPSWVPLVPLFLLEAALMVAWWGR